MTPEPTSWAPPKISSTSTIRPVAVGDSTTAFARLLSPCCPSNQLVGISISISINRPEQHAIASKLTSHTNQTTSSASSVSLFCSAHQQQTSPASRLQALNDRHGDASPAILVLVPCRLTCHSGRNRPLHPPPRTHLPNTHQSGFTRSLSRQRSPPTATRRICLLLHEQTQFRIPSTKPTNVSHSRLSPTFVLTRQHVSIDRIAHIPQ